MNTKYLCLIVGITVVCIVQTVTLGLSAPVMPLTPTPPGEGKRTQPELCKEGIMRTGSAIACLDDRRRLAENEMQPYAVMLPLTWDNSSAFLGFPCTRSMGCGVVALDALGHGGNEQWPVLIPGLTTTGLERLGETLTSARGKSLLNANGEDFTKLVMERNTFLEGGASGSGRANAPDSRFIFWDRLLSLGPLLLLFLEKLLGRL